MGMKTKQIALIAAVAALALFSRLPFIDAGYGGDPDAWRMTLAARAIADGVGYVPSRLPGYPIPEYAYSLIGGGRSGAAVQNVLTALIGAVGIAFFALTLLRLRCRSAFLAALALAFTPVVYINSTTSMDYVWALGFILASLYYALAGRPLAAGLLLGIAVGCRLTSAGMLLPLALLLIEPGKRKSGVRRLVIFFSAAVAGGVAFYIPVLTKYGFGFLALAESNPSGLSVLRKATVGVFGILGLVGIAAILIARLVLPGKLWGGKSFEGDSGNGLLIAASISGIAIYFLAFLAMPHEAAYVIPAVPLVIILMGVLLPRRLFSLACILLIASPFVLGFYSIEETRQFGEGWNAGPSISFSFGEKEAAVSLAGPVFVDWRIRLATIDHVGKVIAAGERLPGGAAVIVGYWAPHIKVVLDGRSSRGADFYYSLGCARIRRLVGEGRGVYFLREAGLINIAVEGCDPAAEGAVQLEPLMR